MSSRSSGKGRAGRKEEPRTEPSEHVGCDPPLSKTEFSTGEEETEEIEEAELERGAFDEKLWRCRTVSRSLKRGKGGGRGPYLVRWPFAWQLR